MQYIVKQGDNLTRIGEKYGVPIDKITGYKSGDPNLIFAGETIDIPVQDNLPPVSIAPSINDSVSASSSAITTPSSTNIELPKIETPPVISQSTPEITNETITPIQTEQITETPVIAPIETKKIVEGKLLNRYGARGEIWSNSGGVHLGTDFVAPEGTITNAPDGEWEVIKSGDKNDYSVGYGRSVVIKNTSSGETLRYSHLNTPIVIKGEKIKGGTPIGLIGSTGNSTESHLDIEYRDPKGNLGDIMDTEYSKYF